MQGLQWTLYYHDRSRTPSLVPRPSSFIRVFAICAAAEWSWRPGDEANMAWKLSQKIYNNTSSKTYVVVYITGSIHELGWGDFASGQISETPLGWKTFGSLLLLLLLLKHKNPVTREGGKEGERLRKGGNWHPLAFLRIQANAKNFPQPYHYWLQERISKLCAFYLCALADYHHHTHIQLLYVRLLVILEPSIEQYGKLKSQGINYNRQTSQGNLG